MRTLKYAILGLLCRQPLTGYDIAREFEQGLGDFWSAKHSQIYPELRKLAEEGLVSFHTVIQGEKLEKKLYTATEKGRLEFGAWLRRDEPLEPTPKDTFRLRMYLSDSLDSGELLELLEAQREKREAKLERLKAHLGREFPDSDPNKLDKARRGDYLVLRGAILREESYLEWLEECRSFLNMQ